MGGRRRRRVEPTDEWNQLKLLYTWPEQVEYEEIRPRVLFGSSVAEEDWYRRERRIFECGGRSRFLRGRGSSKDPGKDHETWSAGWSRVPRTTYPR
jgi:hypothetical protein